MSTATALSSQDVYEQLCQFIPGGVNSAGRAFKAVGILPLIIERAEGSQIFDVDGRVFDDYCLSWGALMHGHANPCILDKVRGQLEKGTTYGLSCIPELELAKAICKAMPSIEQIRFVSSGTEATASAVRLARGVTGRDTLVTFNGNYHGHADLFLVSAGSGLLTQAKPSSAGVPRGVVANSVALPYNDIEEVRSYLRREKVAAVIIEPIAGNMGVVPADSAFLRMLREETEKQGALLIFDEVISGFRVGFGGAGELYGIRPDLTCLGKIIGGGFPAAAFGGRRELMQRLAPIGDVYQAGTLSGNPVAMCAGREALRLLEQPESYNGLQEKADLLCGPVHEWIARNEGAPVCLQQVGSMFTLFFGIRQVRNMDQVKLLDKGLYSAFFSHMLKNGVFIPPSPYEAWFISTVHTDSQLEKARDLILQFLKNL